MRVTAHAIAKRLVLMAKTLGGFFVSISLKRSDHHGVHCLLRADIGKLD